MWYIVGAKFPWCRKELFGRFWKQQTLFNQISHDNTTNLPRVRKKVHSVNLKFIVFSSSCLKLTSPKYFPLMYFSNLHKEMNNEKKSSLNEFEQWKAKFSSSSFMQFFITSTFTADCDSMVNCVWTLSVESNKRKIDFFPSRLRKRQKTHSTYFSYQWIFPYTYSYSIFSNFTWHI